MRTLTQSIGINQIFTSPHHPPNEWLAYHLCLCGSSTFRDHVLPFAIHAYNASTQINPFYTLYRSSLATGPPIHTGEPLGPTHECHGMVALLTTPSTLCNITWDHSYFFSRDTACLYFPLCRRRFSKSLLHCWVNLYVVIDWSTPTLIN